MTDCIKTGARVYLADYDVVLPTDIFSLGKDYVVFKFNMNPFHNREVRIPEKDITHSVTLGLKESQFFWSKKTGTLVVPKSFVTPSFPSL